MVDILILSQWCMLNVKLNNNSFPKMFLVVLENIHFKILKYTIYHNLYYLFEFVFITQINYYKGILVSCSTLS